jgi:Zn-dependent peptidase ImmA (M78 family)
MNPIITLKVEELLRATGSGLLPINPFRIASHLNVEVRKEFFVGDLSGVLLRQNGTAVIAVNAGESPKRQRFTIAHELGHYVLNHKGDIFVDHTVLNRRDGRSAAAVDFQEIEANAFAAELLMPGQMLLARANDVMAQNPMHTQQQLLKQLAFDFEVSEQAMTYRLMNLGIMGIESV